MGFSVLVWNIRQFTGADPLRVREISTRIRDADPDIFGIIEFRAKDVARTLISEEFTDYDFGITDSKKQLDFLIGWRRGQFAQMMFTQRREFQVGNVNLRPGGLLSFRETNQTIFHNILYLHSDMGREIGDYDRRQTMFQKVWSMKAAIQALPIQNNQARFIVIGDLNTMGRKRTNTTPTIRAQQEIDQLRQDAVANGMQMLAKSSPLTYRSPGGSLRGDLDHVIISNDLQCRTFNDPAAEINPFQVVVTGWNQLPEPDRTDYITNISDHCMLYIEVL